MVPSVFLRHGRNREERRERPYFNGFHIFGELEELDPTVASVAFPTSPHRLHIAKQLIDRFTRVVGVDAKSGASVHIVGFGVVSAKNHANIRGCFNELVPNLFARVTTLFIYPISLRRIANKIASVRAQIRVSRNNAEGVGVFRSLKNARIPRERLVTRSKFKRDDHDSLTVGSLKLVSGVFEGLNSIGVFKGLEQNALERRIAIDREIGVKLRFPVYRGARSIMIAVRVNIRTIVVVTSAENIWANPV